MTADTQLMRPVLPKSLSSNDLASMHRQAVHCCARLGPDGVEPLQVVPRDRCSPCAEELSLKPIKRSRSDQSLSSAAATMASSHGYALAAQHCPVSDGAGAFVPFIQPKSPVVLSSLGSTNSCASLDSETTRASSVSSLPVISPHHGSSNGGTEPSCSNGSSAAPLQAAAVTIVASSSAVSLSGAQPRVLQRVSSSEASDVDMPEPEAHLAAALAATAVSAAAAAQAAGAAALARPAAAAGALAASPFQLAASLFQPPAVGGGNDAAAAVTISSESSLRRMSSADAPAAASPTPATAPIAAFGFGRHQQQQPGMGFGSAVAAARQAFGAQPFGVPMPGNDTGRLPPSGRSMRSLVDSAGPALFALGEDGPVLAPLRVQPQAQAPSSWHQHQLNELHEQQNGAAHARGSGVASSSSSSQAQHRVLASLPSPVHSPHAGDASASIPPSAAAEDEWAFQQRATASSSGGAVVSPPGASGSGSGSGVGRRRSSLEVSMPWRAQLERVIAHAAAASSSSAPDSPMTTSDHSASSHTDANSDDEPAYSSFVMPAGAESERLPLERRPSRRHMSYLEHGSAAQELFLRLNRARQTLDFTKRQAAVFAELNQAELSIWEALELASELSEYEAALAAPGPGEEPLDPRLPMMEHAFQVAELCRLAFPDKDWMHLVGLIHGLGKLLAHPKFGLQPQWAVCGETYPLGVKFAPQIGNYQFFSANPDRRRRAYSTPLGVYQPKCGLRNVYMSWGAPEYLYIVLVLNQVQLPDEALFMIRNQKFLSVTKPGNAYRNLLSNDDVALLPLLSAFQRLSVYRRVELPPDALKGQAFKDYYQRLIDKYLGDEKLFW